jgi:hypothetical protein
MATMKETAQKIGQETEKARNTKSTRLWFMVMIFAVIIALYMMGIIKK